MANANEHTHTNIEGTSRRKVSTFVNGKIDMPPKKKINKRGEHNHRHEPSEHNTRQFNSIAKIDGVGDGNYPN